MRQVVGSVFTFVLGGIGGVFSCMGMLMAVGAVIVALRKSKNPVPAQNVGGFG